MNIINKLKSYLYLLYEEIIYRCNYIFIFMFTVFINILLFWNEILIYLLGPLENLILKSNKIILHKILKEHYNIEDLKNNISTQIDFNWGYNYNNEIPYYEINISNFDNIDTLIVFIYIYFIVLLTTPYILYQFFLFSTPIFSRYEKKNITKKLLLFYSFLYFIFIISYNIIIPIFFKNLMIATEEISFYEFEIEFNVHEYLINILNILLLNNLLIFYSFLKKKTVFIIILLFIVYYLFNISILIITYVIILFFTVYLIKKIYLYINLFKYQYWFSLNRNIK